MSSLEEQIANVGYDVAFSQLNHIADDVPRSITGDARLKALLAVNTDNLWKRTSPARISYDASKSGWRIRVSVKTKTSKNAQRYNHPFRYDTKEDAYEDAYNVRYSKESGVGKESLDRFFAGDLSELKPAPVKRGPDDFPESVPKKKRSTMRTDLKARMSSIPCRNPNTAGDMNPHTLCREQDLAGNTLRGAIIPLRLPFLSRPVVDHHLKVLEAGLRNSGKEWWRLVPYGEDEEVRAQASPKAIEKVKEQSKLLHKALTLYNDMTDKAKQSSEGKSDETNSTWGKACADAAKAEFSDRNGQTIERWYILFRNNTEQPLRFPFSRQGKGSKEARCPFVRPEGDTNPTEDADTVEEVNPEAANDVVPGFQNSLLENEI